MLTQYDEYPVHQSPYSFSLIPNSDLCWNDGMYHAVYDRQGRYVWYTYLRVHPNTDVVDGCVGLMYDGGRHYTIRFSRQWRPDVDTRIGPFIHEFPKPFKEIRIALEDNDFDMTCDITWLGVAPAFEEEHHYAVHWGKVTTDQTRFTQNGTARGWIKIKGERIDVDPGNWWGCRDHSWGVYQFRQDLAQQFMPPREPQERERALRLWVPACFDDHSAFYHFHEDRQGRMGGINDVFGNGFEGRVDYGWGETRPPVKLVEAEHELKFMPGTRMLTGGLLKMKDEHGRPWEHEFRLIAPPMSPQIGAWKDGRGNAVYRGKLAMEAEEIDLRKQPVDLTLPSGRVMKNHHGMEYISEFTERSDDGVKTGYGHVEMFRIMGRYARYGFDRDMEGY